MKIFELFRIYMQDDVNEACGAEDGFQPTLKPYQLIGVNFLMLLYRKKIGGGTPRIYIFFQSNLY